jgi:hypothetical protein
MHMSPLTPRPSQDWGWCFDPDADGHSALNAVALCKASVLAYAGAEETKAFLSRWGFTDVTILKGALVTEGFVASDGKLILVALRGTEPDSFVDWCLDLDFHQCELIKGNKAVPGRVHGGFARGLGEVLDVLLETVQRLRNEGGLPLFVTGHSLGGALAVAAAAALHFTGKVPVHGVYTYGQPRVGDAEFSKAYDEHLGPVTFRYVNDLDVVPHVPAMHMPYAIFGRRNNPAIRLGRLVKALLKGEAFRDLGRLKLLLADGTVTDSHAEWLKREVTYSPELFRLVLASPEVVRHRLKQVFLPHVRILDHDPVTGYLPRLRAQHPDPC